MAEEKDATSVPLSQSVREGEEGGDPEDPLKSPSTSPDSSTRRVSLHGLVHLLTNYRNMYIFIGMWAEIRFLDAATTVVAF